MTLSSRPAVSLSRLSPRFFLLEARPLRFYRSSSDLFFCAALAFAQIFETRLPWLRRVSSAAAACCSGLRLIIFFEALFMGAGDWASLVARYLARGLPSAISSRLLSFSRRTAFSERMGCSISPWPRLRAISAERDVQVA